MSVDSFKIQNGVPIPAGWIPARWADGEVPYSSLKAFDRWNASQNPRAEAIISNDKAAHCIIIAAWASRCRLRYLAGDSPAAFKQ